MYGGCYYIGVSPSVLATIRIQWTHCDHMSPVAMAFGVSTRSPLHVNNLHTNIDEHRKRNWKQILVTEKSLNRIIQFHCGLFTSCCHWIHMHTYICMHTNNTLDTTTNIK